MVENKYCTGAYNDDKLIEVLAKKYGEDESREFYRQMFTTIVKLSKDCPSLFDIKLINNVLKELRYAFKIFKKYRETKKVVIFGSHKLSEKTREFKATEEFARKISDKGFMIITGGGGGIMEAGNKGAQFGKSFSVNIKLPTEQLPNAYVRGEKLITLRYFFTRKLLFIKESDATALFPGGFGTYDEGFEVLTLLQTGKTPPRPLVFVDVKFGHYWKDFYKWVKNDLLKYGLINKNDMNLFHVTDDVDDAVDYVSNFYRNYHSLRYVGNRTIIRMKKAPTNAQLARLNKSFKDILETGCIEICSPTKEEIKDRDNLDLFRLCLNYDHTSYGRLHCLIKELNSF